VDSGRLLRDAARDVELRRALLGQGRGVDHRRRDCGVALRASRHLVGLLLRQRRARPRRGRDGVRPARGGRASRRARRRPRDGEMIARAALARDLAAAYANRQTIAPPSSRDQGFDLTTAYAVEGELVRLRRAAGHQPVGRKVGYANKAMWRVLKIDTL